MSKQHWYKWHSWAGFPLAVLCCFVMLSGTLAVMFSGRAGDGRARFYADISRANRQRSADRRGSRWVSADSLAMAVALQPEGVREARDHYLAVELEGRLSRGATLVDWQQRTGKPANARIVLAYDQAWYEAQVRAALGA